VAPEDVLDPGLDHARGLGPGERQESSKARIAGEDEVPVIAGASQVLADCSICGVRAGPVHRFNCVFGRYFHPVWREAQIHEDPQAQAVGLCSGEYLVFIQKTVKSYLYYNHIVLECG